MKRYKDKPPKKFREKRCNELHPTLRRSVCTIILAACGVVVGLTVLLVCYDEILIAGIIVFAFSAILLLIGVAWFCWSYVQLRNFQRNSFRMQKKEKTPFSLQQSYDPAALSAAKWPTKHARLKKSDSSDDSSNYTTSCNDIQERKGSDTGDWSEKKQNSQSDNSV